MIFGRLEYHVLVGREKYKKLVSFTKKQIASLEQSNCGNKDKYVEWRDTQQNTKDHKTLL